MKGNRFWWHDWREWDLWRILALAIPVAVGIVTVIVGWRYR